jgi:hypothetical protein
LHQYKFVGPTSVSSKSTIFLWKIVRGKTIFPLDDKDPFAGKRLSIHFQKCEERGVRIAFFVGEDSSRTWVLAIDSIGLLLKHDHRHKDGTPDSVTLYEVTQRPHKINMNSFFLQIPIPLN